MEICKPMLTPIKERLKLIKDGSGDFVDATNFRRLVRSLRYLTATRPDIVYGVGITNSDWAGDTKNQKSTSNYVFHLVSEAFSWYSNKQQVVALSMAKA
ncbi:uncharacterized mitochondrial protein AtMg00810-like [Manihot esculenta]|uniref:uncharacterized mitochondrial protein AtMg00810-like n=1 Tax=Manihot esculenta TaxID=3983 RepID=UPI000B5D6915|nr:uncharacterized mitochondrial protein AtMg00810-like [Manihot esculenta]